jgi:hypothetical protein
MTIQTAEVLIEIRELEKCAINRLQIMAINVWPAAGCPVLEYNAKHRVSITHVTSIPSMQTQPISEKDR